MLAGVGALLLFALAGLGVQRTTVGSRARAALWTFSFWVLAPALVLAAFLTIELDRQLVLAVAAAGLGNWLVFGTAYAYAVVVTRDRDERGCLALVGAFGNTGYLGLPLVLLAFGRDGVADAVVYDRLGWIVPVTAVTTTVARTHGLQGDAVAPGTRLRAVLLNPPLAALAAALLLRALEAPAPWAGELRGVTAVAIGPVGFLLLGLSLPLGRAAVASRSLQVGAVAVGIRLLGGPLALFAAASALGADVPGPYYLLAGVPGAFHLLVLARVYGLRPELMRALVVASSALAVLLVGVGSALR